MTHILLNDRNVEQILAETENVTWLIFFKTSWCTHCHALVPIWNKLHSKLQTFEEMLYSSEITNNADLSGKYSQSKKFKLAIVDGDESPHLANRFFIEGYPTIVRLDNKTKIVHFPSTLKRSVKMLFQFATTPISLLGNDTLVNGNNLNEKQDVEQDIFSHLTFQDLAPTPQFVDVMWYQLVRDLQDLKYMYYARPDLIIFLLLSGCLIGVFLSVLSFYFCIDRSASVLSKKYYSETTAFRKE